MNAINRLLRRKGYREVLPEEVTEVEQWLAKGMGENWIVGMIIRHRP